MYKYLLIGCLFLSHNALGMNIPEKRKLGSKGPHRTLQIQYHNTVNRGPETLNNSAYLFGRLSFPVCFLPGTTTKERLLARLFSFFN